MILRDPMILPTFGAPAANDGAGRHPAVLQAVRNELNYGVKLASDGVSESADLRAWQFRHLFDRVILLESGVKLLSESVLRGVAALRQASMGTLKVVEQISDACGIEAIDDSVVGLFTAMTLAVVASESLMLSIRAENMDAGALIERRLAGVVLPNNDGVTDSAYSLWNATRALRSVLVLK